MVKGDLPLKEYSLCDVLGYLLDKWGLAKLVLNAINLEDERRRRT